MISDSINPGPFSPPIQRLPWWTQRGYGVGNKFVKARRWLARNIPGLRKNRKKGRKRKRKNRQKGGFHSHCDLLEQC